MGQLIAMSLSPSAVAVRLGILLLSDAMWRGS